MGWFRRIVATASLTVLALTTALVVAAAPPTEKCSAPVSGNGVSATARERDGESVDDHDKGYGNDDRCSDGDGTGDGADDDRDATETDDSETDGNETDGNDGLSDDSDERNDTEGSDGSDGEADDLEEPDATDDGADRSDDLEETDGIDEAEGPDGNDGSNDETDERDERDETDRTETGADDSEIDRSTTVRPDGESADDTAETGDDSDGTEDETTDAANVSDDRRSAEDGSVHDDTAPDEVVGDDRDGQTAGSSGDESAAPPTSDEPGPPTSPPATVQESGSAVLRSVPQSASDAPQPASIGRRVALGTSGPVARVVLETRMESLGQPMVMSAAPLSPVSLDHVVTPLATSDLVARTFVPATPDVATTLDTILGAARSAASAMAIPAAAAGAVMVFGWAISPAVSGASKSLFALFR